MEDKELMSNYASIKTYDIANGRGIRLSVFFSGCKHQCKGCFNKELWDYNYGKQFTKNVYDKKIKPFIKDYISGISILGGEPLCPENKEQTLNLCKWFKEDFPDKNIWIWTGYTYDELIERILSYDEFILDDILLNIDVLVDGRFIDTERDLTLKWRGSKNQRVIDVKKTLEQKHVVLYNDDN